MSKEKRKYHAMKVSDEVLFTHSEQVCEVLRVVVPFNEKTGAIKLDAPVILNQIGTSKGVAEVCCNLVLMVAREEAARNPLLTEKDAVWSALKIISSTLSVHFEKSLIRTSH